VIEYSYVGWVMLRRFFGERSGRLDRIARHAKWSDEEFVEIEGLSCDAEQ